MIVSNAFKAMIIWLSFFSLWLAGNTKCVLQTRKHSLFSLNSSKENIAILSALRNPAWSTLFFFFSSFTLSFKVSDHMRLNLFCLKRFFVYFIKVNFSLFQRFAHPSTRCPVLLLYRKSWVFLNDSRKFFWNFYYF